MLLKYFFYVLIAVLLLSFADYSQTCVAPAAGLVDLYGGDKNSNDLVGANNGILLSGATYSDLGKVGPAFSFDGLDDSVNVASSVNLGTSYTVEFWIYPTKLATFQHLVSNSYTSPNYGAIYLYLNQISYWQNGAQWANTPTNSVPLNAWTHVALVYNGSTDQIYLNGVASGAASSPHSENFNNPFRIGYAATATDDYFGGRMDEVSLYNTALTAGQLTSIYNAGFKGKCVAPAVVINDTSVLEGNAGTTAMNFNLFSVRATSPVQVSYATADGTATAPVDYQATSGTVVAPAVGTTNVVVSLNGDTTQEQNENLFVNLTNPVGGFVADAQAIGTIFSDDCTLSPLGLTNLYRGDGDALDSIGTAQGTLENGTTFDVGNTGQAFSFDGNNDDVLLPVISLGSSYSVEMWIKPNNVTTGYQNLVSNGFTSTTNYGAFYLHFDHLVYWHNNSAQATSPTVIMPNNWTHVALTYDGSQSRLYVNGVLTVTGAVHSETFNNAAMIGYSALGEDQHFRGSIDEVSLYNRTLTDAEVLAVYTAGGGGKCGSAGNIWTGSANTNWNTAANWTQGVPTLSSDVVIPATGVTNEPTLSGVSVTVNSLNIASGRTLTVAAGSSLTISNDLINSGTFAGTGAANASGATTSNAGVISVAAFSFDRGGAQTVSGSGSFISNTTSIQSGTTLTLASNHQFANLTVPAGAGLDISTRTMSVSGNFSNTGTFTVTGSTVVANGATLQTLTNATYVNLTANNAAGVILGGNTTVTYLLTLTSDLQTGSFVLTMPYSTQETAGPGDVVGNFRLTDPFSFPSRYGNFYNQISFTNGSAPSAVTVNLVKSAPVGFPHAVTRTYTITPNGGSGYTATVQLHYQDSELNGNIESLLKLYRHNGTSWINQGTATVQTTDNWVRVTGVTQFSPWAISNIGPTAASVSVAGRVLTSDGRGISNATVQLTDAGGSTRNVLTNPFGYYSFADVHSGETYILSASAKRYRILPRTLSVEDELTDADLIAE